MENVDKIKRGEPVQNPDKMVSVKVAADAAKLRIASGWEGKAMDATTVLQVAALIAGVRRARGAAGVALATRAPMARPMQPSLQPLSSY